MKKLWDKDYTLDQLVEKFMTGDDPTLDQALIPYDCYGSMAHVKMLQKINLLSPKEAATLIAGLGKIIQDAEKGQFSIKFSDEDVHTAVELELTRTLGDLGKKLHTARSRNDQVILDLRLYCREAMLQLSDALISVCRLLTAFAEEYREVPIPGRTHFQRAMPSSLGLWAGAFAESVMDNASLLVSAYDLINQCPLGSAASYGVSLPIDRQYVADLLGFAKVQNNVLYVNNSRGKFEGIVLHVFTQIMNDLSKLSTDIIIFSAPEFGYLALPEKFCPGSSLMPQKRNPCPLELIRAKSAIVQGNLFQILEIIRGLPSGYNRDFQETKRPFMQAFEVTLSSLTVFAQIFRGIQVNTQRCIDSFSSELFATDRVLDLVAAGVPFRDAYKQVGLNLGQVEMGDPIENIRAKTHLGATGALGLDLALAKAKSMSDWASTQRSIWHNCKNGLEK